MMYIVQSLDNCLLCDLLLKFRQHFEYFVIIRDFFET